MQRSRLVFTDGGNTKAINPWDVDGNPEAWTWYSGQPKRVQDEYYGKVAAMYRAINLKANTVSSIPFALLDSNGEEYDSSRQWENKVGFLPNPQELFRLNVLSYMASNTIYNVKTSDAVGYKTRGLYHALPQSFDPVLNGQKTSVEYIERVVGTKSERYQYPKDKNLIRMWRLDHTTELLPSVHTESQAIASAAEIILYADFWVGNFFRRGGIKPTLIAMKGLIDNDVREQKERSWSNWLRGIGKQFSNIARIYNAESLDPRTIGAGVDDMKDNNIYRQAIENIAMGTGMPLSLLLANSANMATAQEEKATWYESDIIPFVNWMAYEYNTQLFQPLGLFLEFRPETVDANQEDETSRASAVNVFMDFLNKCPTYEVFIGTAETFGYELSESLISAADKYYKEKKEAAAVVANNMQPTQKPKPAPMEDEPADQEEPEENQDSNKNVKEFEFSSMIALRIPDAIRNEIESKYSFIDSETLKNLHITLVYIGDNRTVNSVSVIRAVSEFGLLQSPIKGKIQGLARFVNGGERDPLVCTFDSPQMPKVYGSLTNMLDVYNVPYHKEHGFIPHMTLAYIPSDADMPIDTIEPLEINFSEVYFVNGNTWYPISMNGQENKNYKKWIPSLDELEEMRVWREVALRRHKKSEGLDFEYLPHYGGLPDTVISTIKAKLLQAKSADEIKAAFVVDAPAPTSEIKELAEAINRMADARQPMVKSPPLYQ